MGGCHTGISKLSTSPEGLTCPQPPTTLPVLDWSLRMGTVSLRLVENLPQALHWFLIDRWYLSQQWSGTCQRSCPSLAPEIWISLVCMMWSVHPDPSGSTCGCHGQVIHKVPDGRLSDTRLGEGSSAHNLSRLHQHVHGKREEDHWNCTSSDDPLLKLDPLML